MKDKALFLVSVPKAGTHMLYTLAEAMGYKPGVVCPDYPLKKHWYCVEYSHSHTAAKDFFIDTVRRSPFGNRDHPFPATPTIFMYRNPLDIVSSESNYYHRDGKTAFGGYLRGMSRHERLLRLIDDPLLLGSIRERVLDFAAWLYFENVIPVSFEELVGEKGGGSDEEQLKTIESLQKKLDVPGNASSIAQKVFDPNSPTFAKGRIGGHRDVFTDESFEKFFSLPQDFMDIYGYDRDTIIPKRVEEFRNRELKLSEIVYTRKKDPSPFFLQRYTYPVFRAYSSVKRALWEVKRKFTGDEFR